MSTSVQYSANPLLASRTPVWRSKLVVACVALSFFGLVGRAAHIQYFSNDFYQRQGEVRYTRNVELPANRGRILDRNGLILASSVPVPSIWAVPEDVAMTSRQEKELARLLGMSVVELNGLLADDEKNFVWLKRQVDEDTAQKVAALGIKGVFQKKEYRRQYPEGEAAAHVLGFTNIEDQGLEGVELAFNKELAGKPGSQRVIKDRLGRVVESLGEATPPADGRDLQLSVDSKVQFFAYQKLKEAVIANKARAGSVVVLDTATGELLALANYPSYAPDKRRSLSGEQLRNRALTDTFEPGSVMKPFVVGLALEQKLMNPLSLIETGGGKLPLYGAVISDSHPNGTLTVEGVIQKSSNIGTTKIAMQLDSQDMWELYSQAGFGQRPQVEFPGAVSGRLRPYKTWRPIEKATMSYGYGLSASLFQMARSYTVFSNDGRIIPATILKSSGVAQGTQVLSADTAGKVRKMLKMAAGPGGTGQKAQTIGYSVGGKSGTAYKQVGKGYGSAGNRKYRAWFVGMAPIDQPRIVVAVMVDEPSAGQYYGGAVAAPVFSEVVQQTLRIMSVQPDMAVVPQIVASVDESF